MVYTVTATDADANDQPTYTLSGIDAAQFELNSSSGELRFVALPDIDNPQDANGDSVYETQITITDLAANSSSFDLTITVTDEIGKPPEFASSHAQVISPENSTSLVYDANATDPNGDSIIYSLAGTDASHFEVNSSTGEISFYNPPDFEAPADSNQDNNYTLTIFASDPVGNQAQQSLDVLISNINDNSPSFAAASYLIIAVPENSSAAVHEANASDADGDSIAYSLSGIDSGVFYIDPVSGELSFANPPDFENPQDHNQDNAYELVIIAFDGANSSEQNLTVEVTNLNDNTPYFAIVAISVVENNSDTFYTSVATDLDSGDAITYRLSGIDASAFDLNTTDGGLRFRDSPNFENPHDANSDNSYELEINASDGVNNSSQILTVAVTNVNEAPSASISISPDANSTTLTTATTVTLDGNASSDPDGDTLDYTWSQPSGQYISLSSAIAPSATFTVSEAGTYTFTLTVSDREFFAKAVATVTISSHLPSDFTATAINAKVKLNWSSHSSNTLYTIYRSSDPSCDQDNNYSTACSSSSGALFNNVAPGFIDTGLANGSTYYYWLEASLDGVTQSSSIPISATPWSTPLNDTGIDWEVDYETGNISDCSSNVTTPQDCNQGRDTTHNNKSDGHAGFSFTRLNADGTIYTGDGNYDSNPWSCVQDNVTGLIWEVKTDDGGLHDANDTYNWYNTDPNTNGDFVGYDDEDGAICYGYNSSDSATYCNTEAFVNRVNATGLCGAKDWRLPKVEELRSIASYGHLNPSVDRDYFPNTNSSEYWSASPYSDYWIWYINFDIGDDHYVYVRADNTHARLVRSGQNDNSINDWPDERYQVHGDGTVTDTLTSLMWMQCSLGQTYLSGECTGSASDHSWQGALELSEDYTFATYSDWRLPNIKELSSLVARDRHEPAINSTIFPSTSSRSHWSASPHAENTDLGWMINFSGGYDVFYYRGHGYVARLVRDITPESNTSIAIGSAPEFSVDSASIEHAENSSGIVYDANASDADSDTLTYSIAGADSSLFVVDSASGALYFRASPDREQPLDADANNAYELNLVAEDLNGNHGQQNLTVVVTDVNDNYPIWSESVPSGLSMTENNTSNIYISATDADGDTVTYDLYGDDANAFDINTTAGAIWFLSPQITRIH